MTTTIDPRVFEEFASILEGIKPFRNPNKIDFDICRGFKKETTIRCGNRPRRAEEQEEFDNLLSELSARTKHIDATSLYAKMKRFIALTHCTGRHLEDALKAFNKWKAHRKAVVSNPLPMTPSRSATPQADLLEPISDSSDEVSSVLVDEDSGDDDSGDDDSEDDEPGDDDLGDDDSEDDEPGDDDSEEDDSEEDNSEEDDSGDDDSGDDGPVFDSYVTEKMKNLKLDHPAKSTHAKTDPRLLDEAKAQREKFKALGAVIPPKSGKKQDDVEILKTIKTPPNAERMYSGIVYVLEHIEISGIFKIGWSGESSKSRLKQPKNCYKHETRPIHESEGGKFIGAFQAERIAHAMLDHKRIKVYHCPHCDRSHDEWFLVSKKEALTVVKFAEQWMKIPAYSLRRRGYKLTPAGNKLLKKMFPFSIPKMSVLINKIGKSDDDSGEIFDSISATTARETGAGVSSAAAKKNIPRIFVDGSEEIMPSVEYNLRDRSPVRGVGDKRAGIRIEIEEVSERRESRSRATTPEGDFITVTEYTTTRCRRVSVSNREHNDGAFDLKDKRQRGTAAAKV